VTRERPSAAVRHVACVLTLAICAFFPLVARADPAGQARFHDELARSHYKAGRFEQALREFFLEQRASPNPRISFNIALCYQELKRKEEAFQYLSEYLDSPDSDAERRAYAERVASRLKQSLALVRVESTPPGASIYVDRRELGSYGSTPKVVALTPGEHQVWAELDGYRPASGEISARQGEELALALAPVRILGALGVTSPVSGQVSVRDSAGVVAAEGPSPLRTSVPPGNYEVSVTAPGYLTWRGLARVDADQEATVAAAPLPAPEPSGSITVTSNVPGALVELNGQAVGFSPTVLPNVKVGRHSLSVVAPNILPWSGQVDVKPEQRSWLTVSLEEPPTVRQSPATWIAGGIAATALVTGGVLAIFAAKTHADFEGAPLEQRSALRERGMTLNTAADIAFITAGVAAVTTVVLYFTTKEVRGRPSSASTTISQR
jgi:outer membrane receptor for ferrienterochelin and colicins